MRVRDVRRGLFLAFIAQEALIAMRATPEQRRQAPEPPYPALLALLIGAPLFIASPLPRRVERAALALQTLGWLLELSAMTQLARRRSFGIHATAATSALQDGLYRLEHPIYLGILISLLGWTLPLPPSSIAVALIYVALRRAVRRERAHLAAALQVRHRGVDSFLWPEE